MQGLKKKKQRAEILSCKTVRVINVRLFAWLYSAFNFKLIIYFQDDENLPIQNRS